jgi:hypothetical protein
VNTYVAKLDKNGCVIGAELMLQETFERLLEADGFTVYRERGITYIRLIQGVTK